MSRKQKKKDVTKLLVSFIEDNFKVVHNVITENDAEVLRAVWYYPQKICELLVKVSKAEVLWLEKALGFLVNDCGKICTIKYEKENQNE